MIQCFLDNFPWSDVTHPIAAFFGLTGFATAALLSIEGVARAFTRARRAIKEARVSLREEGWGSKRFEKERTARDLRAAQTSAPPRQSLMARRVDDLSVAGDHVTLDLDRPDEVGRGPSGATSRGRDDVSRA